MDLSCYDLPDSWIMDVRGREIAAISTLDCAMRQPSMRVSVYGYMAGMDKLGTQVPGTQPMGKAEVVSLTTSLVLGQFDPQPPCKHRIQVAAATPSAVRQGGEGQQREVNP